MSVASEKLSVIKMCPLDLEAGKFLMTLKVEATWWWAEESVRGEEVKTGVGDNSFKKVGCEEEVARVGTCCERFKQFKML